MPGKPWTDEQKAAARQRTLERRERRAAEAAAAKEQEPEGAAGPLPSAEDARPPAPALRLEDFERERIVQEARKIIDEDLAKKAEKERAKFLKDELDKEILRQRREAGLTDHRDDIIEFMVNVAPYSPGLVIDGALYPHGAWITKTRREYDSYREYMQASWQSEERAGNPNKKFEEWRRAAGVMNPMLLEKRMPDGTYTLNLDYSVRGIGGQVVGRTSYNA